MADVTALQTRQPVRTGDDDLEVLTHAQPEHAQFERVGRIMERYFKAQAEGVAPEIIEARQLEYQTYLATPTWQQKRQQILLRAAGRCEKCHAANTLLEVHHLTYARRGAELETDLVALCPACHEEVHR